MFYAAAAFNWLMATAIFFGDSLFMRLGMPIPLNPTGRQTFCLFVAVFGYGYFLIARDPIGNLGLVQVGIVGKLAMFLLFVIDIVAGTLSYRLLIPALGDVLFALLFLEFMLRGRSALNQSQ